eukprot:SAG31_NODE_35759_length_320_cov_0.701357_1_plen_54_part_01
MLSGLNLLQFTRWHVEARAGTAVHSSHSYAGPQLCEHDAAVKGARLFCQRSSLI